MVLSLSIAMLCLVIWNVIVTISYNASVKHLKFEHECTNVRMEAEIDSLRTENVDLERQVKILREMLHASGKRSTT